MRLVGGRTDLRAGTRAVHSSGFRASLLLGGGDIGGDGACIIARGWL